MLKLLAESSSPYPRQFQRIRSIVSAPANTTMHEPPVFPENRPSNPPLHQVAENKGNASRLLNHRPTIFLMLFCVTGFLGIPFLLRSTAFTKNEKILWSVIVTIYTCLLLWCTGAIVWWSYSNIRDSLG